MREKELFSELQEFSRQSYRLPGRVGFYSKCGFGSLDWNETSFIP